MNNILEVENLRVQFTQGGAFKKRILKAVDGVSLEIGRGEALGLVGESGCGKTSVGKAIVGLNKFSGDIKYSGKNRVQMIFQDPYSSLDPRMKIRDILLEPLKFNRKGEDPHSIIENYIEKTGLRLEDLNKYPHQFSGGQRQRVGIARALALEPDLIVADEPVSALDISIQAQILNLLVDLKNDLGLSMLFISHDLSVVHHLCDRVAVMYLGKIVEVATSDKLFSVAMHPYTRGLIESIPQIKPGTKKGRAGLKGEIPSPVDLPKGCRFSNRCPYATKECYIREPELAEAGEGHRVACHNFNQKNSCWVLDRRSKYIVN